MACYSPLRAVVLGTKPALDKDGNSTGRRKKIIKVLPKDSDFTVYHDGFEYISLPCGHCIGCRLQYSRVWADRCIAEASYHDNNIFLTLTYNDDHLPGPFELDDGSLSPVHPLVKRDVQLFIKRLRRKLSDQEIRYFLCGEYGPKNMRPHYHLILFGCCLDDLELLYCSPDGFSYFTSKTIEELWWTESDPKHSAGFHIITSVNWNTCAYVARYIMKKQYGDGASCYEKYNYPKEFTLMSRRPGIGKQFYEDNKFNLYGNVNGVYIPTSDGARKIRSNRYYDRLYDVEYPDHFSVISDERKQRMLLSDSLKAQLTDKFYLDRLESENIVKSESIKSLKRGDLYEKKSSQEKGR